jgi:hypothetical protein
LRGGREDEQVEGEGAPVHFTLAGKADLAEDLLHFELDGGGDNAVSGGGREGGREN